ncbi:Zinc resistance conferring protein [Tieghemiomyces parasiticus]|uniref:Zinc resistance conferring protein n=1 Tax=Tieghemiomyces parasiticus TaxID=78921 RepID=A0A9W7ZZQ7_9FUNG|nr:Zinc resistance conferring protein [Tieghemiomyces parasiticus]
MALSRSAKVGIVLAFSAAFFLLEIIVGYVAGSVALVADSFHMLNDVLGFVVALIAMRLATRRSPGSCYTYGWGRAEVLGALINASLLLGLCLTIYIQAIQRFFEPTPVDYPQWMLAVGCAGLVFNCAGIFLFRDAHAHAHGGRGCSGHAHNSAAPAVQHHAPSNPKDKDETLGDGTGGQAPTAGASHSIILIRPSLADTAASLPPSACSLPSTATSTPVKDSKDSAQTSTSVEYTPLSNTDSPATCPTLPDHQQGENDYAHGGHLNMRAVFLHVLGDALANVAVIITALVVWFSDSPHRHYADPVVSILMNTVIVYFTIPLVLSAARILLQSVPESVSLASLRTELQSLPQIRSIHDLHVWQLLDKQIIASVHVTVPPFLGEVGVTKMTESVVAVMHRHGIHSTTIQPEFAPAVDSCAGGMKVPCRVRCVSTCTATTCCPADQDGSIPH